MLSTQLKINSLNPSIKTNLLFIIIFTIENMMKKELLIIMIVTQWESNMILKKYSMREYLLA